MPCHVSPRTSESSVSALWNSLGLVANVSLPHTVRVGPDQCQGCPADWLGHLPSTAVAQEQGSRRKRAEQPYTDKWLPDDPGMTEESRVCFLGVDSSVWSAIERSIKSLSSQLKKSISDISAERGDIRPYHSETRTQNPYFSTPETGTSEPTESRVRLP